MWLMVLPTKCIWQFCSVLSVGAFSKKLLVLGPIARVLSRDHLQEKVDIDISEKVNAVPSSGRPPHTLLSVLCACTLFDRNTFSDVIITCGYSRGNTTHWRTTKKVLSVPAKKYWRMSKVHFCILLLVAYFYGCQAQVKKLKEKNTFLPRFDLL